MKFEKLLRKYTRSRLLLDREPIKDGLLADLGRHKRMSDVLYSVYFGVVCFVCLGALLTLASDTLFAQSARVPILGGAGVTVIGAIGLMRRTVKEWTRSDMLITLAAHADEAQLQRLLETLLTEISGKTKAVKVP